jgi:hypothetical protein
LRRAQEKLTDGQMGRVVLIRMAWDPAKKFDFRRTLHGG